MAASTRTHSHGILQTQARGGPRRDRRWGAGANCFALRTTSTRNHRHRRHSRLHASLTSGVLPDFSLARLPARPSILRTDQVLICRSRQSCSQCQQWPHTKPDAGTSSNNDRQPSRFNICLSADVLRQTHEVTPAVKSCIADPALSAQQDSSPNTPAHGSRQPPKPVPQRHPARASPPPGRSRRSPPGNKS